MSKLFVQLALVIIGVIISLSVVASEELIYQNWVVESGPETTEAYTANDSNSSLGLFCGGTTCVFYLNPNLNCQPTTKNTVLMNGSTVSAAIGMQCALVGKYYFQILESFDQVLAAVKTGDSIGFAVALQGGAFSVYRFSLNGALPALQRTLDEAAKKSQVAPTQPPSRQSPGFKGINL